MNNSRSLIIAGVDEAGRGPLAGAVVAAAVILGDEVPAGLADSKKLSAKVRESLEQEIQCTARAWCVASASVAEIDQLNILHATMLAMQRAVLGLSPAPGLVRIDGNRCPELPMPAEAIVKGDALVPAISAASILAKVERDRQLLALDARYPGYGFAGHKGYPTKAHLAALAEFGPCPEHRRSYRPVRECLSAGTAAPK